MPVVHITYVEGRDPVKVKNCVKAVARTVAETLSAPLGSIRVYATSIPAEHWAVGDVTKDEQSAPTQGEKS
ncbi:MULTISPECIES: tautomerase family protein [Enterobacteriaceae]|uniref:tautomerase family protein n=1 Tax=Enterobacteriaceae TaxID=543 RepID=UPI000E2D03E3|nr:MULTISPECIES: tautomerase family protein [Klebsiella]MBZ1720039.1 tautomerase family protein [Klebsiella pneumoniae]MCT8891687.1 tautomerase family protein [Klebsiella quasipneumoniae subsp. similipneumoniae]SWE94052.1 4-oxalocrotonate tautomerase [Klebsiella pneumoniae]HED9568654.1 tautomerase family protein [Klebsiella pneumoniae]